jgi:hypothetical protein
MARGAWLCGCNDPNPELGRAGWRAGRCFFWLGFWVWWEHPWAELGCFIASWPWWAPGGTSHQVGWSGEAHGSRGGAPGGAALTFAPGRAAGAVFFQGGALRDKWLGRSGAACAPSASGDTSTTCLPI